MAFWDKIGSSGDVEDRRGLGGGGLALGGVGGLVLFLAMAFLSSQGVDTSMFNQLLGPIEQTKTTTQYDGKDEYEVFTGKVVGSNNELWKGIFAAQSKEYAEPKLVLFRDYTPSACGGASAAVGPHYCPYDQTIYMDERFFAQLKQLGGDTGDVAQAYVISHEVGHHVQNQLGSLESVTAAQQTNPEEANALSVRLELQADCYAGLWMNSLSRTDVLEPNEIKEALSAAAAVGDDRVQETSGGRVNPENWTHGSSADRVKWFNRGYESGQVSRCNTVEG